MGLADQCCASVPVDPPSDLPADQQAACEGLVADLPDRLIGEDAREVSPDGALGAAWGDPALVLSCGVGELTVQLMSMPRTSPRVGCSASIRLGSSRAIAAVRGHQAPSISEPSRDASTRRTGRASRRSGHGW